jgi:hypothetical protein
VATNLVWISFFASWCHHLSTVLELSSWFWFTGISETIGSSSVNVITWFDFDIQSTIRSVITYHIWLVDVDGIAADWILSRWFSELGEWYILPWSRSVQVKVLRSLPSSLCWKDSRLRCSVLLAISCFVSLWLKSVWPRPNAFYTFSTESWTSLRCDRCIPSFLHWHFVLVLLWFLTSIWFDGI